MKNSRHFFFLMIISILFSIFAFFACSKVKPTVNVMPPQDTTANHSSTDTTVVSQIASAKFLALGDSYTIGQSVDENQRFPAQTIQLLKLQNVHVSDPLYIATTGWTTSNLLSAIQFQNPAKDFDIVTLLIGVNDQYQQGDTAGYRHNFLELLGKAIGFAANRRSHVFVLSIPDYSVTPYVPAEDKVRVSRQIDEFNAINKEITFHNNVTYVDITPSTRLAATDPSLIAGDGLHPSGKEYAVWAGMLAPLIKKALQ